MDNEGPYFFLGCILTFFVCFLTSINMNVPIHPSSYALAEEVCQHNDGLRKWSKDNFIGEYQAEFLAYCNDNTVVDFTAKARAAIEDK